MDERTTAEGVYVCSVCITQQRQLLDVGADVLDQGTGLLGDPSVVRHDGRLWGHTIQTVSRDKLSIRFQIPVDLSSDPQLWVTTNRTR